MSRSSETHIFSDRTINQISGGFNRIFNHISLLRRPFLRSREDRHSGRQSGQQLPPGAPAGTVAVDEGLRQLRPDRDQLMGGYWALGDRGFAPFQGGTNVFPSPTRST